MSIKDSSAKLITECMEDIKNKDYELYNYIHEMSKTKQKKLIYNILQENVEDMMSYFSSSTALMLGILLFSTYHMAKQSAPAQSFALGLENWFNAFNKGLDKYREEKNKATKAFEYLTSQNYHDCINKCEISTDLTNGRNRPTLMRSLRKAYSKSGFPGLVKGIPIISDFLRTKERVELTQSHLDCLIDCSLDNLSTLVARYTGLYINCIKKSNDLYANTKIYSLLDLGRLPQNIEACSELKKSSKELLDSYVYILEHLFKGKLDRNAISEEKFGKWMDILERKIGSTSDNNYVKMLDVSKQFVGDHRIPNPGVRF